MHAGRKFRISNVRLAVDLCLGLCGILFFGYLSLSLLIRLLKLLSPALDSENLLQVIILIGSVTAGVIMLVILVFMTVGFATIVLVRYHLFSLTVDVLPEGIKIFSNTGTCYVPKSDIMYILKYTTGMTLVWRFHGKPITFYIRRSLFGSKSLQEMAKILSLFEGYTHDRGEIKKIKKDLKLNHVFRKNCFEYQLSKLSEEQVQSTKGW